MSGYFFCDAVLSSFLFVVPVVVVVVGLLVEHSRGNRSERRTMRDTGKETGSISERELTLPAPSENLMTEHWAFMTHARHSHK